MRKSFDKTRIPYDFAYEFTSFPLAVMPRFGCSSPGLHTHEGFCEIVLIVSGAAAYTCEDKHYTVGGQELLVTLPGMHHNYEECNFDYYNILVDFDALKLPLCDLEQTRGYQDIFVQGPRSHLVPGAVPQRNFLDVRQFAACVDLLRQMTDLRNRREPGFRMAMLANFAEFLRIVCRAGEPELAAGKSAGRSDIIGDLALGMSRHSHQDWSIERLCKLSRLSRPVLFREFKKYYHTSPNKFLLLQRLRKARALLESSELAIEAVASQCGFSNGSYFSSVFVRAFGMTPLHYRRNPQPELEPKI